MAPWISLALMIVAGLGLVLRHDLIPLIGFDLGIASGVIAIAGLIVFSGRNDATTDETVVPSRNYRQPMIVTSLAVLLFVAYTFAGTVTDMITGTSSNTTVVSSSQISQKLTGRVALRLRRQSNGLFRARGRLNGSTTQLTVDTGAATVVLSADDARRAGVAMSALAYTVPVKTANGIVYAAPTRLERVFVGPLGAADVPALVAKPGRLEFSLLGMSFLKRLSSYEIEGDHLTLEG